MKSRIALSLSWLLAAGCSGGHNSSAGDTETATSDSNSESVLSTEPDPTVTDSESESGLETATETETTSTTETETETLSDSVPGTDSESATAETPTDSATESEDDTETETDVDRVTDCTTEADYTPCKVVTVPDRKYDICSGGACVSPGCGDTSCNAPGPYFPIPPAEGHDAFVTTTDDEPLVRDEVTGLEWQGCPAGLSGPGCGTGESEALVWSEAVDYCDALRWAGLHDWHLPSPHELHTIAHYGTRDSALWASATSVSPEGYAWAAAADDGFLMRTPKLPSQYSTGHTETKCVRGTATLIAERFTRDTTVADEPVVHDNATGVEWTGCLYGQRGANCDEGFDYVEEGAMYAWQDCDQLVWGGHNDWQLADIKQLFSLLDDRREGPAARSGGILRMIPSTYWSSQSGVFWNSYDGSIQFSYSSSEIAFLLCTRMESP